MSTPPPEGVNDQHDPVAIERGWVPAPRPSPLRVLASLYLAVFGRKAFYRWNQLLLTVAVKGMCGANPMMKRFEPGEDGFMRRFAGVTNPTVVDVGANVGTYSARLKELCPSARIWAFEPHPGTFKQLTAVAAASGFTAVNVGLSDHRGKAQLYDRAGEEGGTGSSYATLHRAVIEDLHDSKAVPIEVDVTTLDDFVITENIQRINLLKVDAEGHELQILKGAVQAITAGKVDLVQFEFNEMNVVSRVFFHDFYEALPGFSFYRMAVDGLAPLGKYQPRTHELFIRQNIVAIRDGLDYRDRVT